jgi:hypothetical protein
MYPFHLHYGETVLLQRRFAYRGVDLAVIPQPRASCSAAAQLRLPISRASRGACRRLKRQSDCAAPKLSARQAWKSAQHRVRRLAPTTVRPGGDRGLPDHASRVAHAPQRQAALAQSPGTRTDPAVDSDWTCHLEEPGRRPGRAAFYPDLSVTSQGQSRFDAYAASTAIGQWSEVHPRVRVGAQPADSGGETFLVGHAAVFRDCAVAMSRKGQTIASCSRSLVSINTRLPHAPASPPDKTQDRRANLWPSATSRIILITPISMVRTVDTRLCAITAMSITSMMVICITCMGIMSTNTLSRSATPIPCAARPTPDALTRMGRAADTIGCPTVITSIISWRDGCITHMTGIAMITGR